MTVAELKAELGKFAEDREVVVEEYRFSFLGKRKASLYRVITQVKELDPDRPNSAVVL